MSHVVTGGAPLERLVGVGRVAPLLVELGGQADQHVEETGPEVLRPQVDLSVERRRAVADASAPRPPCFARYMARSARRIIAVGLSSLPSANAMPTAALSSDALELRPGARRAPRRRAAGRWW